MAKAKKILLAEDDGFISRAYKDGIERGTGFDVEVVSDGEKLFEALEKGDVNLIMLDLMMPIKDGFEVLEDMTKKWVKIRT